MAPGCIYWSLPRGEVPSDAGAWGKANSARARVPNLFKSLRLPRPSPKASCPPAFAPSFGTCGPPPVAPARRPGPAEREEPRDCQNKRSLGHSQGDKGTLGNLGRACD